MAWGSRETSTVIIVDKCWVERQEENDLEEGNVQLLILIFVESTIIITFAY